MKKILPVLVLLLNINVYGQLSLYLENRIAVPSESVSRISISADGRFLAYGCKEGPIYIWDLDAKRQLHRLNFHKKSITSLVFDSKNQKIISMILKKYFHKISIKYNMHINISSLKI